MRHEDKIAIAVRDDLPVWQKLNVVAFLAGGVAGNHPDLIGEPYGDASGNRYLSLLGYPVLCFAADLEQLRRARQKSVERGLSVGVYTEDMFATFNDIDNRATVASVTADDLNLVGLAIFGGRKDVDKALKGLKLHG